MADPNRNVPIYHDPAGQILENIPEDEFFDIDFPISDDLPIGENVVFAEDMTQFGHGNSRVGPSDGVTDQSNENLSGNLNAENSEFGNPIPLLQWPDPPEPYICSNCQVLREIIHTSDGEIRKFEIHGRLGMILHGILEICHGDMTAPNKEYQLFDFSKETIPDVKTYLSQYCKERSIAGYIMVKDPLLAFNEALSVGSDWEYGWDIDDIMEPFPIHRAENIAQQPEATNQPNDSQPQAQSSNQRPKRKRDNTRSTRTRTYQEQRDFIADLKVKDFVDYFNLKIDDAAEKVGICPTSFKSVLRREKFSWPGPKIQQLEEKIEERSKDLNAASTPERASAEAEIEQLKQEIASYSAPFR